MSAYLLIAIIPVLGIISVQDFKTRQISILWIAGLFVLVTLYSLGEVNAQELFQRIIYNSLTTSLILLSGTLLVKLKKPGYSRESIIGAGDFLFLTALSPLLSFERFLVFLNFSFLLILCITLLYNRLSRKHLNTIPLAGGISLITLVVLLLHITGKVSGIAFIENFLLTSVW